MHVAIDEAGQHKLTRDIDTLGVGGDGNARAGTHRPDLGAIDQHHTIADGRCAIAVDDGPAGGQRVLCGDCTDPENWLVLLGERLADMVWTDPPYNVNYDAIQQRRIDLKRGEGKTPRAKPEEILNDDLSEKDYGKLLAACFAIAFQFTKPGGTIYCAHADSYGLLTRQSLAGSGFYLAQCLIWVKNSFTLGRQD